MPEDGRDKQWLKPGSLVIFSKNPDTAFYADLDPSLWVKYADGKKIKNTYEGQKNDVIW